MDCNFIDLEIHVQTNNRAHLAVCLPLLGGLFSEVCRNVVCPVSDRDCHTCALNATCDWHCVFGQLLSVNPEALRRHQKPPLPFVFSFPLLEKLPASPGIVPCGLVVIGSAIARLGLLIEGFTRLLSDRVSLEQAEIVQLFSRDFQGSLVPLVLGDRIGAPENLVILSLGGILESRGCWSDELDIVLHSPLKLLADGHQARHFEFCHFARMLLRRVSSLVYYYESCETGIDFRSLSLQADAITCLQDEFVYDPSPAGIKRLSGIAGSGCYKGDFNELMPFLIAGEYFHVGKSAAFGMGNYTLASVKPLL
jgi:hypothetical protein